LRRPGVFLIINIKLITSILLFFIGLCSQAQTNEYQNLLVTALGVREVIFVHSKPMTHIQLDSERMWGYFDFLQNRTHINLDTIMFSQIIQNSKLPDTTLWLDKELPNYLLVDSRTKKVSIDYATQKLALVSNKKFRYYNKQIFEFNKTDYYDRNIYYFSRPIFDNSKTFAIIQWDNSHSGLGGGGEIVLYHLKDNNWEEVGAITNWKS
jgi:hypothetical protein